MKVINIHTRKILQPKAEVARLFKTLASENDMMLATDKWSPMKFDKGLQVGSAGGHGPIKYFIEEYHPEDYIKFQFTVPGFNGFHHFKLTEIETNNTELKHIVDMTTTGSASLKWSLAVRWLHDAYIEDAFDKVENHFSTEKKVSRWSVWVKILRTVMKPKTKPKE